MKAGATPAWARHAAWLLVILAVSGLAWRLSGQASTGLIVAAVLLGCTQMALDVGKTLRPFWVAWQRRGFHLSIGSVMVLVGLAAGYLGLMRALHDAYPTDDVGLRLMIWGFFLLMYSMFCVLGYAVWFGVLRFRAIVADDRSRPPGRRRRSETMFGLSKKERWAKIQAQPFPPEWSWIMARNVPIYARLSELDKAELRGLVQVFLAEKVFEGCGGQEINDEVRVTIAAQACLLLLRRDSDVYPNLITVLVYPSAYVSNMPQHSPQGIVTEGPQGRLGEAWTAGVVVLSWDDVKQGATDVRDGHNVVFHEFAHQLDTEDGSADGSPVLPARNLYSAWGRVLGEEYKALQQAAETGKKSVLDTYGATEPAEFFAVATEAFFEKPVQLKTKHPELYEELKIYYNQDPEADFGPIAPRAER